MTLNRCKNCNTRLSLSTRVCAFCGTDNGVNKALIVGVFLILILFSLMNPQRRPADQKEIDAARLAVMTPAQRKIAMKEIEARDQEKQLNDEKFAAQYICHEKVLQSLHDPDSSELESEYKHDVTVHKNGNYSVYVKGRAKNGFGALRLITVKCDLVRAGDSWISASIKQID